MPSSEDIPSSAQPDLLRRLLEHSPDRIYFKDAQSRFLSVSNALAVFFGLPNVDAAIGKTDRDFFNAEHADAAMEDEQEIMRTGKPVVGKVEKETLPDGRIGWASTTKLPLRDEAGNIIGTFGISRDVTERKLAEEKLEQTNAALAIREKELLKVLNDLQKSQASLRKTQMQLFSSEKLAALGTLVAGVAHEINNPLAFVMNNMAILQRDWPAVLKVLRAYQASDASLKQVDSAAMEQIREMCDDIDLAYTIEEVNGLIVRSRDGLGRIMKIVHDLRDFARQDADGDFRDDADLNVGIESTLNIARGRALNQKVELVTDLVPLPRVRCSAAKINQVLLNLIVNAIDACVDGGHVVVRSRPHADPQNGQQIRIQVVDNGIGIEPTVREKIFEPFFTTKPQGQGTGLGLAISYGIVREHRGNIEVESVSGKGSVFTVILPVMRDAAVPPPPSG